jgi:hypothetical protein
MAFLGMRLVVCLFHSRSLSMAARRLGGLLIGGILHLIIVTFCPLFLLYLIITPFGIGGRRITHSWPCVALRSLLTQCLLHSPQSGGVVPSLGPPLSGGFFGLTPYLHPHDLNIWNDTEMRDEQ